MKSWLFNIAAAGSLLAGALVVILWIRGEFDPEFVRYSPAPGPTGSLALFVINEGGAVSVGYLQYSWLSRDKDAVQHFLAVYEHVFSSPSNWTYGRPTTTQPTRNIGTGQGRFSLGTGSGSVTGSFNTKVARWRIPDWFLLLLSGVLPAIWLNKFNRRRHPAGCCPTCGYDLRATPDRCPECGAIPQAVTGSG